MIQWSRPAQGFPVVPVEPMFLFKVTELTGASSSAPRAAPCAFVTRKKAYGNPEASGKRETRRISTYPMVYRKAEGDLRTHGP